jgi:hypothetical protein
MLTLYSSVKIPSYFQLKVFVVIIFGAKLSAGTIRELWQSIISHYCKTKRVITEKTGVKVKVFRYLFHINITI